MKPTEASQGTATPNDTAWAILYSALIQQLGLNPQNFQLIYPMTSWNWPTENLGFTSGAQYDFCATIPQWSAVGAYVSAGTRYDTAYQQFLNFISFTTDNPNAVTAARNNLTQATSNWQHDLNQAQETYNNTVTDNTPSFSDWLLSPAGAAFAVEINADTNAQAAAQSTYNALVKNPNLTNALNTFANSSFYTSLDDPATAPGAQAPQVPIWSVPLTPQQWVNQVQGGGGTGGSFSFSNSAAAFNYSNTWAQGSTSVSGNFWSVFANGSWQQVTEFLSDSSLTCSVSFAAWDTISITPSGWYSGTTAFRGGPFLNGATATQEEGGTTWMFGQGGVVPLFKSAMLVAYQPTITISVSQATFNSFQQQWSAATGIQVGPFQVGGSGGGTSLNWSQTGSGMTMQVVSTSSIPLIFGIEVAVQPQ